MADLSLAKMSSLQKALLGGLGLGGIVLVGFLLLIYSDVSGKIDNAKQEKIRLEDDLTQQKQAQASYLQDSQELVVRQQRQRDLNKALPETTEVASFLSAVQQVSNVSGVDLKGWQPGEEKVETFFAKVPMKLELGGRFPQIAKFVYEMGRVDRIINVENLELTDPKLEGDEIKLKAKCLATSFHLLSKAKPKTPAQPGGKK